MDTRILTEDEMGEALAGMKPRPRPGRTGSVVPLVILIIEAVAVAGVIGWWLL